MPKLDPASEVIRRGLITRRPDCKAQYSAMNKAELRDELQFIVKESIETLESLAEGGWRTYPNRDAIVNAAIKEVCSKELHISVEDYCNFMNSF